MSFDDEDRPGKKGKSTPDGVPATKVAADPVASNPEMFEWMEELFYADALNYPERIEIWSTVLRRNRVDKIKKIRQWPFAPQAASEEVLKKMPGKIGKPTKEALVHLSNRTVAEMQRDCDAFRKPQTYSIYAVNMASGAEPYAEFSLHLKPKTKYRDDDEQHEDDDEEGKLNAQERMHAQNLDFMKTMFQNFAVAWEGIIDRDDRIIRRLSERNETVETRLDNNHDQLERALSLQAERDAKRRKEEMWLGATQKGLDMAMQLAPPILTAVVGDRGVPQRGDATQQKNVVSMEGYTIKQFWNSLDQAQQEALIGVYEGDATEPSVPGILTYAQAALLIRDIPNGMVSVDDLDKLLPGGELEINQSQLEAIMKAVPMQALASLHILLQSRLARQQAQGAG